MKEGIHPDYHEITVKLTDGSSFKTFSTWGKKGDTLQLDIDVLTHNAWVGGKTKVNERAGNVAKFNQKFGSMKLASMSDKIGKIDEAAAAKANVKKKVEKKAEKPAEAAPAEDKK
jgi:large subunit ribosomal protein L31